MTVASVGWAQAPLTISELFEKVSRTYEGEVIDKWAREGKGENFYLKLSKDGKTFTREIGKQQYKHKKIEAGDYVKKAPNTFEIQVIPPSKLNSPQD